MPIVAGIAGNSGNQTLTLLVRSLATGQITEANQSDVVKKKSWWLWSMVLFGALLPVSLPGALLRLSGRHEARLYHVLGHDAEYAHGRDCGYPRSDYA